MRSSIANATIKMTALAAWLLVSGSALAGPITVQGVAYKSDNSMIVSDNPSISAGFFNASSAACNGATGCDVQNLTIAVRNGAFAVSLTPSAALAEMQSIQSGWYVRVVGALYSGASSGTYDIPLNSVPFATTAERIITTPGSGDSVINAINQGNALINSARLPSMNNTLTSAPNLNISGGQVANGSMSPAALNAAVPVNKGGTGVTSLPTNAILIGGASGIVGVSAAGNSGKVLQSNGSSWVLATMSNTHNPVTIGDTHGLNVSSAQVLSIDLAGPASTGALSDTDWLTFSGKAPASGYMPDKVLISDPSGFLATANTSPTELNTLVGVTTSLALINGLNSPAQAQIDTLSAAVASKQDSLGVGSNGQILQTNGSGSLSWASLPAAGNVNGPVTSTSNAIPRFNGTGGTSLADSGVTIDASNNVAGIGTLNASGVVTAAGANLSSLSANRLVVTDSSKNLTTVSAAVGDTELGYLTGLTSALADEVNGLSGNIQTQIDATNAAVATKQAALGFSPVNKAGDAMSGNLLMQNRGEVRLGDAGAHFAALRSVASLGSDITFTLPSSAGNANQVLQTDGAGNLSWAAQPTGTLTGPGSSTASALARWNGTSGTALADSAVTLDASGNMGGLATVSASDAVISNLSMSRLVFTDGAKKLISSTHPVTDTEVGYLSGVTAPIQTQIGSMSAAMSGLASSSGYTPSRALVSDGAGALGTSAVSTTELGYLSGLGSSVQTQLNSKQATLGFSPVNKAGDSMNGALLVGNQNAIQFGGTGATYVAFKGPASIASNVTWTLPNADGTSGQVIKTTGTGGLSWATVVTGSSSTLSGSGVISVSGAPSILGASAATISISTATAGTNGVLTSTDWNTFNGKASGTGYTASKVIVSTGTGGLTAAAATTSELGYLVGATSAVQTQLQAKVSKAGDAMTGALSMSAQNAVQFAGTGATYVAFKGPASIASNVTWTLPNADGTNGQVLKTSGTGGLSWSSVVTGTTNTLGGAGVITVSGAPSILGAGAATISVSTAAAGTSGILTSTDWNTFNGKAAGTGYTASKVIVSTGTGGLTAAAATTTELGYLVGATSAVQTQLQAKVNKAGDAMTGALSMSAQNAVQFAGTGVTYVAFKGPASIASNVTWTLPNADGTSGQVIKTTGTGGLSWATVVTGTTNTLGGAGVITVSGAPSILGAGAATISISTAAAGTSGILTSTDWNTFNGKAAGTGYTASKVIVSTGTGGLTAAAATTTELGYLVGATSVVQTQLQAKVNKAGDVMTGVLAHPAGTVAAPSITFGDVQTGLYKPATNQVAIATSGAQQILVNTAVTIGGANGSPFKFIATGLNVWTPGAIAAGASVNSSSLTVTGAAVNDSCMPTPPATLNNGLILTCWVSAANTVIMKLNNVTAGSITPTAGLSYRYLVVHY